MGDEESISYGSRVELKMERDLKMESKDGGWKGNIIMARVMLIQTRK
jgi:hypothetical protein